MQYQGGKSRISKQIAERIKYYALHGRKEQDGEANCMDYRERERVATH